MADLLLAYYRYQLIRLSIITHKKPQCGPLYLKHLPSVKYHIIMIANHTKLMIKQYGAMSFKAIPIVTGLFLFEL